MVSVKQLEIAELAPPSEEEFVFLEMHGRLGTKQVGETKAVGQKIVAVAEVRSERKGFFGWLKRIFGR